MPDINSTPAPHYIPHPLYGSEPLPSGQSDSEEEIRRGHWRLTYSSDIMFPETVLAADITKQNYCECPRAYYVDVQKQCRTCARPFIFYALEQRHWFETLRSYVDANCVHCPSCRVAQREPRAMQNRLRRCAALLAKPMHTPSELEALVDETLEFMQSGAQHKLNKLGAPKNKALKTIPDYPGTSALAGALVYALAAAVKSVA